LFVGISFAPESGRRARDIAPVGCDHESPLRRIKGASIIASKKDREKTVDVPPRGSRNPDPITDQPGSHPIETGIGAAVGGAAAGMAVGAVGGPVGAAVGAAAGAVAGGLAGKGVGELIDPTTEDNWLRDNFSTRPYVRKGETFRDYEPAYRYGGEAESRYRGKTFHDVERDLAGGWEKTKERAAMGWDRARDAVKDAYDRTIQLREERLKVHKTLVQTDEVHVRKKVHTENQRIDVPVEREEVVIERRPASGHSTGGAIRDEDIRIPVTEEKVNVSKDTVVKEEVSVGKRKVQDTQHVGGTVRKEEVKVDRHGDVNVKDRGKR
jgi:uncharacterized protein (TIGR02271 family)